MVPDQNRIPTLGGVFRDIHEDDGKPFQLKLAAGPEGGAAMALPGAAAADESSSPLTLWSLTEEAQRTPPCTTTQTRRR